MRYLFFLLILSAACQPRTAEKKETDSTPTDTIQASNFPIPNQPTIIDKFVVEDFENHWDALLEPGTPVMSDTTEEATLLMETIGLMPITIVTTSTQRKSNYGSSCSEYYSYEVRFSDHRTG